MLRTQAVEVLANGIAKCPARLQRGVHIGHLALDQLKFADRLAELPPVVNIGDHVVHDGLHNPDRAASQHGALIIKPAHQHPDAAVYLAKHVLAGHAAVLEHQLPGMAAAHPHFVELLRNAEARHPFFNQECRDAPGVGLGIRLGVNHERVGIRPVGDPHLRAVQDIVRPARVGAQLHAHDIGSGTRLAHGQRADMFAGDKPGQVLALLGLAAVAVDLVDAQVGVRAIGEPDRGARPRDFLHCHHMRQVAHVGPAVFLADRHPEHADLAHLAPQVHRKLIRTIRFSGERGNLGFGKSPHGIAQHVDIFAQFEIQSRQLHVSSGVTRFFITLRLRKRKVNIGQTLMFFCSTASRTGLAGWRFHRGSPRCHAFAAPGSRAATAARTNSA